MDHPIAGAGTLAQLSRRHFDLSHAAVVVVGRDDAMRVTGFACFARTLSAQIKIRTFGSVCFRACPETEASENTRLADHISFEVYCRRPKQREAHPA